MPYIDKVKSVKNTGVSQPRWAIWREMWKWSCLTSLYAVSVEKLWTQNTRIIHDVWRLLILSNEEKTNDYENFEKGMIYMKILKKGVSRENGEEEAKSMPHAPVLLGWDHDLGLIKGMIWKMTCYDMFIINFNRGNNWFVPKCLVILVRIKYMVYSYRTRKLLF